MAIWDVEKLSMDEYVTWAVRAGLGKNKGLTRRGEDVVIGEVERCEVKVLVARIPEGGSVLEGLEPAAVLAWEDERFLRCEGDVAYRFTVERVSDELIVRGSLDLAVALRCSRCAEFFSTSIGVSDFLRAYPAPEGTDVVDVTEDLREELILHIPSFAVCKEACLGVCAQCGVNLNHTACGCEEDDRPNAWSALDALDL